MIKLKTVIIRFISSQESKHFGQFKIINLFQKLSPKSTKEKNAKPVSALDFSILYTKIPHPKFFDVLSISFIFVLTVALKDTLKLIIMDRLTGVINCFSGKKFLLKEKKRFHFPKTQFLINNCYFQVGNIILRKELSSQWVDILLYFFRTCSCFIMNMSD